MIGKAEIVSLFEGEPFLVSRFRWDVKSLTNERRGMLSGLPCCAIEVDVSFCITNHLDNGKLHYIVNMIWNLVPWAVIYDTQLVFRFILLTTNSFPITYNDYGVRWTHFLITYIYIYIYIYIYNIYNVDAPWAILIISGVWVVCAQWCIISVQNR